jgi:hypothetical protein
LVQCGNPADRILSTEYIHQRLDALMTSITVTQRPATPPPPPPMSSSLIRQGSPQSQVWCFPSNS